jgi:hypothetical protein
MWNKSSTHQNSENSHGGLFLFDKPFNMISSYQNPTIHLLDIKYGNYTLDTLSLGENVLILHVDKFFNIFLNTVRHTRR